MPVEVFRVEARRADWAGQARQRVSLRKQACGHDSVHENDISADRVSDPSPRFLRR